jgi:hypothetical protein
VRRVASRTSLQVKAAAKEHQRTSNMLMILPVGAQCSRSTRSTRNSYYVQIVGYEYELVRSTANGE